MVEAEAIADTTVRGSRTAFRAGSTSIARGRGVFEDLEVKVLTEQYANAAKTWQW